MTMNDAPAGSWWTYLAVVCVGLLFLVTGCVGGNISEEPPLEVDRPTAAGEECPEVEVMRDQVYLAPRVLPVLDHGNAWPIDLRAGEAVEIWIGHGKQGTSLPDLRMTGPEGALLLEKDGWSINDQTVAIETDGAHEITVENQYLTKSAEWIVEIHWYPSIECA